MTDGHPRTKVQVSVEIADQLRYDAQVGGVIVENPQKLKRLVQELDLLRSQGI